MSEEQKEQPTALNLTPEAPLVLTRVHRRKDGGVDVTLPLNQEQTYILLEFAIMALTAQGLATIQEQIIEDDAAAPSEEDPTATVTH